jgi:hypothetical protein
MPNDMPPFWRQPLSATPMHAWISQDYGGSILRCGRKDRLDGKRRNHPCSGLVLNFSGYPSNQALELNRGKFDDEMRPDQRIVTKMPLTELWNESGTLTDERVGNRNASDLVEFLGAGPLQFVVADSGLKLAWIPTEQRFEFWETVKPQIADPEKPIYREQFPNQTAYVASEWRGRLGERLILLEKHH